MELQDKIVLVTGASQGIGRAVVAALAEAGAHVCVNFRSNRAEAESLAKQVEALGREAVLMQADVADQTAVEQMVDEAARRFGRLDAVVTNAAYSDREPFYSADMTGFRRTIDVTMWGAFYTIRAAARRFIEQGGGGAMVVMSSPHAYVPAPGAMAYNMAKAALDQMARTAATELLPHRIRINLIHPGWIDTPGERKFVTEEELQKQADGLPWGRLGRPEEIARGVVFLLDDRSNYITGGSLLIDGGITLPWQWKKEPGAG